MKFSTLSSPSSSDERGSSSASEDIPSKRCFGTVQQYLWPQYQVHLSWPFLSFIHQHSWAKKDFVQPWCVAAITLLHISHSRRSHLGGHDIGNRIPFNVESPTFRNQAFAAQHERATIIPLSRHTDRHCLKNHDRRGRCKDRRHRSLLTYTMPEDAASFPRPPTSRFFHERVDRQMKRAQGQNISQLYRKYLS